MKLIRKLGITANVGVIGIFVCVGAFLLGGAGILTIVIFLGLLSVFGVIPLYLLVVGGIAGRFCIMGIILFCIFNIWAMVEKKRIGLKVLAIRANTFLLVCSLLTICIGTLIDAYRSTEFDLFIPGLFVSTLYFAVNLVVLVRITRRLQEEKKIEALEAENK